MIRLLQYRRSDGVIWGIWEMTNPANVAAQMTREQDTYGYHILPEDAPLMTVPIPDLLAQYTVIDGTVQAKTACTLLATPNPFLADGQDICYVTVHPFLPCTVRVNGAVYALTEDDSVLELTAEVPTTFHVELDVSARITAEPLRVEAR